ncbi:LysE family transporter [Kaustia mangrovi]|uniref:LysE family transporter n=1 Tax=Kaustia mangrovi TaxID=2593653 RepID=A0A7S8C2C5_9HYPH|nr:LysE family transporter [Kaustia mangrovi]QPC42084.1 LysE family transporter [Kaustia mangrovi]
MKWDLVVSGIGIGMAVAAPIGPINVMVLRNALRGGFRKGVSTGLGAVFGDGFFAVVAGFGLTAISELIISYEQALSLVGGCFLAFLGIRTFFAHPDPRALAVNNSNGAAAEIGNHVAQFGTTFLLTVTNPATLMGFLFIFSSVGGLASRPGDYDGAATLVGAVMLGSLIWWMLLSGIVTWFREHLTTQALKLINHVSGGVILAFGLFVLIHSSWEYWRG